MTSLRLAVIGAGHLGRIHAKLASTNEQFDVVGVADPSEASRAIVTDQLGLPVFEDYRQLLDQVDAAVVATPTVAHYEVTSTLLRSGIHCLVEKPLALTSDQSNRLVQIARSHQCVLQVGHVERFNPTWTSALSHIRHPKFIEGARCGPYSGRSTDIGVVMDLMIHDLDLILSLDRSPISSIQASGIAILGSHEDLAEARLEFESGLIANLRASRLATQPTRCMQLFCEGGYANIDFSANEVEIVKPSLDVVSRLVALDELPAAERMTAKDRIYGDFLVSETLPAPSRNAILDEQNDFALSIDSDSSPSVTGEDGARAVEIASRIVAAIESRGWDGVTSKSWRIGAQATGEPRILSLPLESSADVSVEPTPTRRAG